MPWEKAEANPLLPSLCHIIYEWSLCCKACCARLYTYHFRAATEKHNLKTCFLLPMKTKVKACLNQPLLKKNIAKLLLFQNVGEFSFPWQLRKLKKWGNLFSILLVFIWHLQGEAIILYILKFPLSPWHSYPNSWHLYTSTL